MNMSRNYCLNLMWFGLFNISIMFLTSCDEVNKILNPENNFLIEKTFSLSDDEQNLNYNNSIEIIIPSNSLNTPLSIKILKVDKLPGNFDKQYNIGSNQYKIDLDGFFNVNSPLILKIKFDRNKIPKGRSLSSIIAPFIAYNNNWFTSDFLIDEDKDMMIIALDENLQSKIFKNETLQNSNKTFIVSDSYNNSLSDIEDKEKCDCGWIVDYSNLKKIDDEAENNVYYLDNDGNKNGPSIFWWDKNRTTLSLTCCYLKGKEHGIIKAFWPNGSIMGETNYMNGIKDGYYNLFFDNGIKSVEGNYQNDMKVGNWTSWFENGKRHKEIFYEKGTENGFYKVWFANGNISATGNYKMGRKHGKWIEYYENGKKWKENSFDNGVMEGRFLEFWENGNKWNEGNYKNGKQVGIWWYFDKFGNCQKGYDFDNAKELLCSK